jgi:hypothetical protein
VTARDAINAKIRKAALAMSAGAALFVAGLVFRRHGGNAIRWASVLGVAVVVISVLFLFFGIRCPRCKAVIGYMVMFGGRFRLRTLFSMPCEMRICPSCGASVDSETPPAGSP